MLEMQLTEHIAKVETLLENMKLVEEESKMESMQLREGTVELEFLLKEMKLVLKSVKVESSTLEIELERNIMKLKILLALTEFEQDKIGLKLQMLEKALAEELIAVWDMD